MFPLYHKKIPSFTVLELLIVMILFSILIILGFLMTELIFSQRNNTITKITDYYQQRLGFYSLSTEMNICEIVYVDHNRLFFIRPGNDTTIYSFGLGNMVIISHSKQDSLPIKDYQVMFYQNNKPMQKGLVDKVEMIITNKNTKVLVNFQKHYDANSIIKYSIDNDSLISNIE